ncbi:MAG TPA: aminoacyl-tRNA hydrolase [Candidatus Brocadiia bacterium]|nr:aminoacyl-tRNA hydrolase [Candidatus Brocadiia bacterium]
MKIVLGIGNPGERYAETRHNAGFMVVDELVRRAGGAAFRSRFDSLVADVALGGERTLLMKPQTYVNESGRALRQALDWYGAGLEDILVVVDDFNLPLGVLRARRGGSSGGHNGLESIASHLGGTEYARLRVGIGSEFRRNDKDFVLSPFDASDRELVRASVERAASAVEVWARDGIERCMSVCNARSVQTGGKDEKEENV